MGAKIKFNIKVSERTEITANPEELSVGARIITSVGKPIITGTNTMRDAIIQQIGVHRWTKRNRLKMEKPL